MHGVGGHLTVCLQDHTCEDMVAGLLHMCMLVSCVYMLGLSVLYLF